MGTQVSLHLGPQDVQRSLGRRGREAAGPEDRHLQGRAGLSREWDPGASPAQRARPGLEWPGVGGRRDLRTPQPTPQARREPTHTSPPGHWGVREALRAPGPGQALAGLVLAVFGGAGRRQQAGVRSRVVRLKYSTPPEERCGPLSRPAGRSEREAKRKAVRAPRANRLCLRTYHPEGARSHLLSEAKQGPAWLVSWMGDHLEILGAGGFLPTRRGPLAPPLNPPPTPRPNSWIPPAAPAPPRAGGVGGRGPDSRCRPGLLPPGPRAPPHSHSASRTPDNRQSPLHLGLLWLASGNPGAYTDSSHSPSPRLTHCLAGDRARMHRCAQTGHLSCSLILWVDLCLGVGLLNHRLLPLLVPSGTSIRFSIPALPTAIPTHRGGEFPLLHIFSSICY